MYLKLFNTFLVMKLVVVKLWLNFLSWQSFIRSVKKEFIIGRIQASSYRRRILEVLSKKDRSPKGIAKLSKIYLSHISKFLKELEKYGLIKCLTPGLRKGKIYAITKQGRKVLKEIKNNNSKK